MHLMWPCVVYVNHMLCKPVLFICASSISTSKPIFHVCGSSISTSTPVSFPSTMLFIYTCTIHFAIDVHRIFSASSIHETYMFSVLSSTMFSIFALKTWSCFDLETSPPLLSVVSSTSHFLTESITLSTPIYSRWYGLPLFLQVWITYINVLMANSSTQILRL